MKANKKEIRDFNNVVTIAIISVVVTSPGITNAAARLKLKNYITKYVSNRPHSVYTHDDINNISATIIFNASSYKEVDISNEFDLV